VSSNISTFFQEVIFCNHDMAKICLILQEKHNIRT